MESATSNPNTETWQPAWERHSDFGALLRPYSTATVFRDGQRSQPELWDICNGCILWLPPKADVGEIPDLNLAKMHPDSFNHPVLILDIEVTGPRSATVQFARITSRGKRALSQMPSAFQDGYLPIFPTEAHPKNGILLRLENESLKRGMTDISYVSVGEGIFSLDFRALRCYAAGGKADGYRYRLKKESFNQVMSKLGLSPSAWIETDQLWETFLRNHVPTWGERAV